MTTKKYNIIYADPPWQYAAWTDRAHRSSAARHYPVLSLDYLKSMDIPAICERDCALLLWATAPCLDKALELGIAWGFQYKTVAFAWVKINKHSKKAMMGMGYYTRSNIELVLLFSRGKPLKRISHSVLQVLHAPRGPHSQKPAEIRDRIVQLFGDRPRVELFARSRAGFFADMEYAGWDLFGNEVNHSITINNRSA